MKRLWHKLFPRAPLMPPFVRYPPVQSVRRPPAAPALNPKLLAVHVHHAMRKSALD